MQKCATHHRRGIMLADAVMGLVLASTLLTLVALSTGSNGRTDKATQEHHRLLTHAELTLLALQHDAEAELPDDDAIRVEINAIPVANGDQADDDQWVWVEVTASRGDAKASLMGRVSKQIFNQRGLSNE